ncbi:MAG: hypothetical protein ACI9X4_002344 [Glaciecola sp.]|jgi:hypothetical protein
MRMRLIFLWLLSAVLVLAISSCGGDTKDFKPVNKTGALEGGAPDVILFVMQRIGPEGQPDPASEVGSGLIPSGVQFSAGYARFPAPRVAEADLYSLGQADANVREGVAEPVGSPLFQAFASGGYSSRVVGLSDLRDFLAEESEFPRIARVKTRSIREQAMAQDAVAHYLSGQAMGDWEYWDLSKNSLPYIKEVSVPKDPQVLDRPLLSVWTQVPASGQPETLTEEQLHVPLVFSMPGTLPENQVHTQVVSLADVGMTLLDLCGLLPEGTIHNDNEGASFARILQKKPLVWRGFVLAKTPAGAGWIRSTRWRLIRQADGQETLSYIEKDPTSTRDDSNLAGASAQREGLGGRLDAWLK